MTRRMIGRALAKLLTLCVEQRKFALLIPAICVAAKAGYSCKEADVVIEHGRQSTVEVLASVRDLMKQFKLARFMETQ
jgi:hypothetical protein